MPDEEMTIYLHPKLVEKAHKAAEEVGENFNDWMVEAARRQLKYHESRQMTAEWAANKVCISMQDDE